MLPLHTIEWKPAYIYLMKSAEPDVFKIGLTINLNYRLEVVGRAARKAGLTGVEYAHTVHADFSTTWERYFHVLFEDYRTKVFGREWFKLTPNQVSMFTALPERIHGAPTYQDYLIAMGIHDDTALKLASQWHIFYSKTHKYQSAILPRTRMAMRTGG